MNDEADASPATADLPSRPITSRADFQAVLRVAFQETAVAGCREIWLADSDFAHWPLGERAVVDALARWAQPAHRRLHLFAANFDAIGRLHPRWVAWRRQWAHQVECRTDMALEPGQIPTVWIAPGLGSLRLWDTTRWLGRWSRNAADMAGDREVLDAVLQQSQPAFPATVTGL